MAKIKRFACRPFSIVTCDISKAGEWLTLHPEKEPISIIGCNFGFAEEVIGFVEYKDGSFEVGIGECLRPYDHLYAGEDDEAASKVFFEAILDTAYEEEEE